MPKVSIVLPTYNGEKYLRESIESIIVQTFSNWELIIVDDCSTDSTPIIIEEYVGKDARIKSVRNEKNQKLPRSLNIGFKESIGDYLTWTSDDNLYRPNAIEVMSRYLDEHQDAYMVKAGMQLIDEKDNITKIYDNTWCRYLGIGNNVGACFLYRRDVLDKIGEYDTNFFGVEDYEYWLRVEQNFGEIYRIDEILYQYRQHSESLTETKKAFIESQIIRLKIKQADYILETMKHDKSALCQLYYDLLAKKGTGILGGEIKKLLPMIEEERMPDIEQVIVVFGAGSYGIKTIEEFGDKVYCCVDNDEKKVGKFVNGVKIVDFESLKELDKEYCVVISIDSRYIYEIMKQLYENGIYNYCTYQYYMYHKEL